MTKPNFSGYNRLHAWDRAEQHAVEVYASDWESAQGFATVLVYDLTSNGGAYWTRKADLDWRYFGEPSDATAEVRAQWARRAAYDRRSLWRKVHGTSYQRLAYDWAEAEESGSAPFFRRVARSELDRRDAKRQVNAPSKLVLASDRAQARRLLAAQTSREAEQKWAAEDLAAHRK